MIWPMTSQLSGGWPLRILASLQEGFYWGTFDQMCRSQGRYELSKGQAWICWWLLFLTRNYASNGAFGASIIEDMEARIWQGVTISARWSCLFCWHFCVFQIASVSYVMVNCWFGLVVWIFGIPLWKGLLLGCTLRIPNHQPKPTINH